MDIDIDDDNSMSYASTGWDNPDANPFFYNKIIQMFNINDVEFEDIFKLDFQDFDSFDPIHAVIFVFKYTFRDRLFDPPSIGTYYYNDSSNDYKSENNDIFFINQINNPINNILQNNVLFNLANSSPDSLNISNNNYFFKNNKITLIQTILNVLLNLDHKIKLNPNLLFFKNLINQLNYYSNNKFYPNLSLLIDFYNSITSADSNTPDEPKTPIIQDLFDQINSNDLENDESIDNLHFVAFFKKNNQIFELDVLKEAPIYHGYLPLNTISNSELDQRSINKLFYNSLISILKAKINHFNNFQLFKNFENEIEHYYFDNYFKNQHQLRFKLLAIVPDQLSFLKNLNDEIGLQNKLSKIKNDQILYNNIQNNTDSTNYINFISSLTRKFLAINNNIQWDSFKLNFNQSNSSNCNFSPYYTLNDFKKFNPNKIKSIDYITYHNAYVSHFHHLYSPFITFNNIPTTNINTNINSTISSTINSTINSQYDINYKCYIPNVVNTNDDDNNYQDNQDNRDNQNNRNNQDIQDYQDYQVNQNYQADQNYQVDQNIQVNQDYQNYQADQAHRNYQADLDNLYLKNIRIPKISAPINYHNETKIENANQSSFIDHYNNNFINSTKVVPENNYILKPNHNHKVSNHNKHISKGSFKKYIPLVIVKPKTPIKKPFPLVIISNKHTNDNNSISTSPKKINLNRESQSQSRSRSKSQSQSQSQPPSQSPSKSNSGSQATSSDESDKDYIQFDSNYVTFVDVSPSVEEETTHNNPSVNEETTQNNSFASNENAYSRSKKRIQRLYRSKRN
ncbi:uncharacterized protein ASCRUDRAFT_9298 [Ascoidea rubescens DSM 1968]|uniref:ubiquitinyl hydrolase 1 n=1 Tax=Ascoidea rubescens DSM 1968 TaxID=1344418 RepID=A0A1D2VDR3_9ASCO|nr:hypothetical protein ASCRUDRAFT_9298 [Ascoidea rubescens DSM 1968]ODV59633.1 hypothetical protein ASCRUDRAFT_9298 [Ascoidea rubescens DSM 1968]